MYIVLLQYVYRIITTNTHTISLGLRVEPQTVVHHGLEQHGMAYLYGEGPQEGRELVEGVTNHLDELSLGCEVLLGL